MHDHEMSAHADRKHQYSAERAAVSPLGPPYRSMPASASAFGPEPAGRHLVGPVGGTGVALVEYDGRLPAASWVGVVGPGLIADDVCALAIPGLSLLPEQALG